MNIIVIGASAGGQEAIKQICSDLPQNFAGSLFIVSHLPEDAFGYLPHEINKNSRLFAANAEDMEKIRKGRIYIAPPNRHLLIEDDHVRVLYGPKENRFRPAVDPLFRSAAYYYGEDVTGIIVSGMMNDGTAGLWTIKHFGGTAIVQDPVEAEYPGMPVNAMENVDIDYKLKIREIGPLLAGLSAKSRTRKKGRSKPETTIIEVNMAMDKNISETDIKKIGEVSDLTCPECHGSLWKIEEGGILSYRCRTGHAFTVDAYLKEQSEAIEKSMWSVVKGLEENASMIKKLHAGRKKINGSSAENYLEHAKKAEDLANKLRKILIDEISVITYNNRDSSDAGKKLVRKKKQKK